MNDEKNVGAAPMVPGPQGGGQARGGRASRIGIGCLTVMAVVSVLGALLVAFNDDPDRGKALGAYIAMTIVFGASAAIWRWLKSRGDRREEIVEHEKIVLKHAARLGGAATLAQIVEGTPLSSEEASATLDHLSGKGLVQFDLLDDGTVLYRFGGLGRRIDD